MESTWKRSWLMSKLLSWQTHKFIKCEKKKVSNYTKLLILVTKSKMGYRARVWWGTYSFYFMYLRYLNLLAVSMFSHINHWTALLEYNLHTTKLSHFKCTIQWLLANLLNLRVVSSPPKWWCKVGSGTVISGRGVPASSVPAFPHRPVPALVAGAQAV